MGRTGRTWPAILLALAAAWVAAACSPAPAATPGLIATASIEAPASGSPVPSTPESVAPVASASPAIPATAAVPTSPVQGVLLDIDSRGLAAVEEFTLRTGDGRTLAFLVGDLENAVEFPVGHLAEHLATSSPIRVFFRVSGPDLVAYRLEDAG